MRRVQGNLYIGSDDQTMKLNEVAEKVWRMSNGRTSIDDMAVRISEEYEQDLTRVRGDIDRLLKDLAESGLIDWIEI